MSAPRGARAAAQDLVVRIKRHADGAASLSCTRADGGVTWQRQGGQLGGVFPPHDLTHFAVETVLGYRRAFYGLLADGWEIGDFAAPWPRGPVPPEALEVELIVGFFDAERRSLTRWDAAEFNAHAERYVAGSKYAGRQAPPVLTQEQVDAVRHLRDELFARWDATPPGESLELSFVRGPA